MRTTRESARWRDTVITGLAIVLLLTASGQAALAQTIRRPSHRASAAMPPISTPEAQGMSSESLAAGIDDLLDNLETYRIHGVVVIRNGRVVLDARFYPFSASWRHDIASVTKSVTSTLVGIAIDQGYLEGVHLPVLDFFPDYTVANRDARKERMTVEHLLAMRSGFECDPDNSEATLTEMTESPDWVQFTLDLPMAGEPGDNRVYCSPNIHLLSAILQRSTGMSTLEFAQEHLFTPLRIFDVEWLVDPQGLHRGWGDLHLQTVDMAKIGLLYLNGGRWRGRQVVSSWWIEEASTGAAQEVPYWPPGWEYAYLWYTAPEYFYASGRGGQRIEVYPDEDLVIGFNAGDGVGDYYLDVTLGFIEDWVLGAIESERPLPPNPNGVALLASKVAEAASSNEGPPEAVDPLPARAQSISGETFVLDANIYGLSHFRLTFPGGSEATLEVGLPEMAGGPEIVLAVGLDNTNRFSQGRFGVMTAAKASWVSDSEFSVIVDELGLINLWGWDFVFEDDEATLYLESLAGGELPATITGRMAR